jgi:hypothetical protein
LIFFEANRIRLEEVGRFSVSTNSFDLTLSAGDLATNPYKLRFFWNYSGIRGANETRFSSETRLSVEHLFCNPKKQAQIGNQKEVEEGYDIILHDSLPLL